MKTTIIAAALLAVALPASAQQLRLNIDQREAEVIVDGVTVGDVDDFDGYAQFLPLKPGRHQIQVQAKEYAPLTLDITLRRGQRHTFTGRLDPQQAQIATFGVHAQKPASIARASAAPRRRSTKSLPGLREWAAREGQIADQMMLQNRLLDELYMQQSWQSYLDSIQPAVPQTFELEVDEPFDVSPERYRVTIRP